MSIRAAVAEAFCLANGHRFIRPVGSGAFKETFHVVLANGQAQALKVYEQGFSVERTDRELKAMQRCSHLNIGRLTATAWFDHEGSRYLLSCEEFLGGGTLTARLQLGLLSEVETRHIAKQLVSAIVHIASNDLVHRDIKPDNILFRDDGVTPVIVDFGIVRDLGSSSLTHTWFLRGPGTPLYAPPEQLRNEKSIIDWRSDQFSLGVVLCFCIFGLHPYREANETDSQAVERVAERKTQGSLFVEAASNADLPMLIKMTKPWPVQRFRKPSDLQKAWVEVTS